MPAPPEDDCNEFKLYKFAAFYRLLGVAKKVFDPLFTLLGSSNFLLGGTVAAIAAADPFKLVVELKLADVILLSWLSYLWVLLICFMFCFRCLRLSTLELISL